MEHKFLEYRIPYTDLKWKMLIALQHHYQLLLDQTKGRIYYYLYSHVSIILSFSLLYGGEILILNEDNNI